MQISWSNAEPESPTDPRFDWSNPAACVHERLLDETYSARTLARTLLRKVRRRLFGSATKLAPVVSYRGLLVFDRPDLHGGGLSFGQDYLRVLTELKLTPCNRLFELCSGPGYIGYSLLAHGFCRQLALADMNPVAVAAAEETRAFNRLQHRVSIYNSDGLEAIPPAEKWDFVVGNPPHFCRRSERLNIRAEDPDWQLHRAFYGSVKRFLNPGAKVLLQENHPGSQPDVFEPMIREGGGRVEKVLLGPGLTSGIRIYYLLSSWD